MWKEHIVKEQIKIEGIYSIFEAEYNKGLLFKGETHNFWECVYVEQGSVRVTADERVYNLGENEIIFHKPMELHKLYVNNNSGVKVFIFSFSAKDGAIDFFKNKVFALNEFQQDVINRFIAYIRSQNGDKVDAGHFGLFNIYLEKFKTSLTYPQMITTYISQLMLLLCEDGAILSTEKSNDAMLFKKAVRFMENNINLQLSISDISEVCAVSPTRLKHIFKEYADMGVHKYLTVLRMQSAAELLREGVSVTQIAEKLGFGSQGYFSAVFKRELGQTPTEFKNSLK